MKFSVVTCCYNQGQYLAANIEAVLAQDYPDFEHIIVDDGSTDNTRSVCRRYRHVRYVYQRNAGQSAALNRGFAEADGDVIAWVNSDDYHEPGAFWRVAREMAGPGRPDIVAGMAKVVNAERGFMWMLKNGPVPFLRLLFHPRLYRAGGRTAMPCQPSVFFRRSVRERLGWLETDLRYGMDYEYWLRAMTRGYGFQYVPQVFSSYRYHASSHTCELGYDAFLGEWAEVSQRYLGQLSPLRRALAECWWQLSKVETWLWTRHQRGAELLMRRRTQQGPLSLVARALCQAPWLAAGLAARALGRRRTGERC